MFIHRALSSISAKPALVIAPTIVVLVLAVYYWQLRQQCLFQSQLRADFVSTVTSGAESMRLDQVYKESWDHAKLFENFQPQHPNKTCPMGWDWPKDYRQSLIERESLSVIIFFNEGKIAHILEFNNENISLEKTEDTLVPETAVLGIEKSGTGNQASYHLSRAM